MTNIPIEHGPVEILSFPTKHGDLNHRYVHVYQRVDDITNSGSHTISSWNIPFLENYRGSTF